MKKMIASFIAVVVLTTAFLFSGCDTVENLESLPLNIPITLEFKASGLLTISDQSSYCLEQSPTYNDFKDKIDSISFVEMIARVDSLSSNSLTGDLEVKLETQSGLLLYQNTILSAPLATFKTTPFKFAMQAADIQAIDNFLKAIGQRCLKGTITVSNISGGTLPNYIGVSVDILLRAKAKL